MKYKDTSHSIIVPLAKEILRNHSSTIATYVGNEFSFGTTEQSVYQEVRHLSKGYFGVYKTPKKSH